ncbi:MAG: HNH endonuclease [Bacteroidia bacterium]
MKIQQTGRTGRKFCWLFATRIRFVITYQNITMTILQISFLVLGLVVVFLIKRWLFDINRKKRRDYYRNVYLNSSEWQRKRYVVLKRDNWQCIYCGAKATQVHHKKYSKRNIGKEPIDWLVSVCKSCHEKQHS